MVLHLASVGKGGQEKLGNGLLIYFLLVTRAWAACGVTIQAMALWQYVYMVLVFSIFYKMKFGTFYSRFSIFGTLRS